MRPRHVECSTRRGRFLWLCLSLGRYNNTSQRLLTSPLSQTVLASRSFNALPSIVFHVLGPLTLYPKRKSAAAEELEKRISSVNFTAPAVKDLSDVFSFTVAPFSTTKPSVVTLPFALTFPISMNFNYWLTKSLRKLSGIFRQQKTPQNFFWSVSVQVGDYLFSRSVSSELSSAQVSLTSVFGMGTGGTSPSSTPTDLTGLV